VKKSQQFGADKGKTAGGGPKRERGNLPEVSKKSEKKPTKFLLNCVNKDRYKGPSRKKIGRGESPCHEKSDSKRALGKCRFESKRNSNIFYLDLGEKSFL